MFGDETEKKQLDAIIQTYRLVPKYITADHIFLSLNPSGLQSLINYFQPIDIVKKTCVQIIRELARAGDPSGSFLVIHPHLSFLLDLKLLSLFLLI